MVKRELVALLSSSFCGIVIIIMLWLFLLVQCVDLQCVIVVFFDLIPRFFVQGTPPTMFDGGCLYSVFFSIVFYELLKVHALLG